MSLPSWLFFWRRPNPASAPYSSAPAYADVPVLFLDFDGVAHANQNGSLEHLHLIEDFLRRYPQVVVVISSNWRMQYSLEMLRDFFAEDVAERIIGVTPVTTETPYSRHIEILECLADYGSQFWCALDDEAVMFPPGCANLVLTDHRVGVTENDLARVATILGLA